MEVFLIKAAQLILALALLVFIHELGHYIFARIFGIRVDKFYMFFNPWFKIASWKPKPKDPDADPNADGYKPTWRDTEYGLGWLPLGGYCSIAGMIDETQGADKLASEPKSWEFRSKPAWQRLLVMMGGILFNFILAIIIYAGIAFYWGEKYIELQKAYEGMDFAPAAIEAGFRNGDIPLLADGEPIDAGKSDYLYRMVNAREVTVLRNHHDTVTISLPDDFIFRVNDDNAFMTYRLPVVVADVVGGEPAAKAGMLAGDRIVAVDTVETPSFTELSPTLLSYAGKPVTITVIRDGCPIKLDVTPTENGKLGFQLKQLTEVYPTVTRHFGFFQSVPKGWEIGTTTLATYVKSMKLIATKEGAKSLGGFGALGNMFPTRWNWLSFWEITAFLSVALAFMNFLPIPALDGGHVMFLLCEVVSGRKVPERVLEVAQMIGMAFLLILLLYANGNDLMRMVLK